MGEIGAAEVGIGREVDEAEINDELGDLEASNPFLPPNTDTPCGLEVIPVHYDVDKEIEGYGYPGDRSEAYQLSIAEESCRAVVIGVEEGLDLLASSCSREGWGAILSGFFFKTMKTVSSSS